MGRELPFFNYHRDPIATGSVISEIIHCVCCGEKSPYTYVGPVEAEVDLVDKLCPWCIQNGRAWKKFQAQFTSPEDVGGFNRKEEVPQVIKEEICYRTPGFYGWQESKWWFHCGDGAEFLGIIGSEEIDKLGKAAIQSLREFFPDWDAFKFTDFLSELRPDNSPSAYLFKCRRCGKMGLYADEEQAPE